jgi:hypothetical protein
MGRLFFSLRMTAVPAGQQCGPDPALRKQGRPAVLRLFLPSSGIFRRFTGIHWGDDMITNRDERMGP